MSGPSVFLSFSGADRPAAEQLGDHLRAHDVMPFLDERDIAPGRNIVTTIDDAIRSADWFVLLWSHHTEGNRFVETEWTAALMRGVRERRPFLFVVTMDTSALPAVLTPSSFVRFDGDWPVVAGRLLAAWGRDRRERPRCGVDVRVRNDALGVMHVVTVPAGATGRGLMDAVRAELGLKTTVTAFDGQVGARFSYRLEHEGVPLTGNAPLPPALAGQTGVVDLLVRAEWFGPQWTGGADEYRHDGGVLNAAVKRRLADEAFSHLRHRPAPA